jgi:hypothetical protein
MWPIASYVGLGILFCGLVVSRSRHHTGHIIIEIGIILAAVSAMIYAIGIVVK